jgi:hypothetical protein
MTAFNVVRFRIKPGREDEFQRGYLAGRNALPGMRAQHLIKTAERCYCFIGEWDRIESIVAARPAMRESLEAFRETLEDLGNGLGVTDPIAGEVIA